MPKGLQAHCQHGGGAAFACQPSRDSSALHVCFCPHDQGVLSGSTMRTRHSNELLVGRDLPQPLVSFPPANAVGLDDSLTELECVQCQDLTLEFQLA